MPGMMALIIFLFENVEEDSEQLPSSLLLFNG